MMGKTSAAILILCLVSVCSAEEGCDVVLKVEPNGVSPPSFIAHSGDPPSKICVQDQNGGQFFFYIKDFDQYKNRFDFTCDTCDYNVSLFTRSSECEVKRQRVDELSGKTITEYQCNYETSDRDAQKCAYTTKPNTRENAYRVLSYRKRALERRELQIIGPNSTSLVNVTDAGTYKLSLSKILQGSNLTLLVAVDRKSGFLPYLSLISGPGLGMFYVNNSRSSHPENGELGDYQHYKNGTVKYSEPDIQCIPLYSSSCNCTVTERSRISILEKRGGDFPWRSTIMAGEPGVTIHQKALYEVDLKLSLASL